MAPLILASGVGEHRASILRALVLAGPCPAVDVGRRVRLGAATVQRELDAMSAARVVGYNPDVDRFYPTALGRAEFGRITTEESTPFVGGVLARVDRDLRSVDDAVADVDLRWLLREDAYGTIVVHDRSDPVYDAALMEELAVLSSRMVDGAVTTTAVVARFALYVARLESAVKRVEAGDMTAVGRSGRDGCIEIWTEFRRDVATVAFGYYHLPGHP